MQLDLNAKKNHLLALCMHRLTHLPTQPVVNAFILHLNIISHATNDLHISHAEAIA